MVAHSNTIAGNEIRVRRVAYRSLFRPHLDPEAISDLRLALNQSQPLGDKRFYAKIERKTGRRRAARPRGRPRLDDDASRRTRSVGRKSWYCENIRRWPL